MNLESSDHQNLVSYSNMAVNHKFNRYLVIKGLDKNILCSPQDNSVCATGITLHISSPCVP